jgi:hypothetical protein
MVMLLPAAVIRRVRVFPVSIARSIFLFSQLRSLPVPSTIRKSNTAAPEIL